MKTIKKMPGIPEVATSEDKARAYLEATLAPLAPLGFDEAIKTLASVKPPKKRRKP